MVSDMVRHQTIHLSNPDINYVRLENCKYCKMARMRNYDLHRRYDTIPDRINIMEYDVVNFEFFEDVKVDTTVKRLNDSTELFINNDKDFCSICQDDIQKDKIIRIINCGHKFHYKCIDKWLETNSCCPICRYEI